MISATIERRADDTSFELLSVYEAISRGAGVDIRIFRDVESAGRWLDNL